MLEKYRNMLDNRMISATELLDEYIKKTEKEDKLINSFITLEKEKAYIMARRAEGVIEAGSASAMTGIPYAVKDNILTRGIKTTCASKMLAQYRPPYSAAAVERLERQCAVMMGKNNLDEFAMGGSGTSSYFGATKNPCDLERVAGGSSSGSAAAVAAGFTPVSLGSDTGGSVRLPAAFCGVCGLKPTYGRVSRYGLVAFSSSLDQIGILANTAADTGYLLNVIAGYDENDATCAKNPCPDYTDFTEFNIKGKRIGVIRELSEVKIDAEVAVAVEKALDFYRSMGAEIAEVSLPSIKYAVEAYYTLSSAEAASNLARFDGIRYGFSASGESYDEIIKNTRAEGFGKKVKRRIMLGNHILSAGGYDDYFMRAKAVQRQLKQEYAEIFKNCDLLITPTAPTVAYGLRELENDIVKMCREDICTVSVSLAGLPAISLPCGKNGEGMPIGMSIVGREFAEAEIIAAADLFEKSFPKKGAII